MPEPQYEGGGFNNSLLDGMSPVTRARVLQADVEHERQLAAAERERKQHAEEQRERGFRASVQAAIDRGEVVDMRQAMRDGGVGRTPAEVVEHASMMMDLEDARLAAEQRKAFNEFQSGYYADVPNGFELEESTARAERNAQLRRTRQAEIRRKVKEQRDTDQQTVRLARSVARLHDDGVL